MKIIIGILAILLPLLSGAQSPPIKPLKIGDAVPDIVFNHVINYKTSTAKLSDFKGKLVILDFWASWCTSCLHGFPRTDSLQGSFGDEVQILLVNPKVSGDSLFKVNRAFRRLKALTGKSSSLPVILYDETAYAYFPFHELPNYVWIGSDGIVKAITSADQLTTGNISAILKGKDPGMPIKKDSPETK